MDQYDVWLGELPLELPARDAEAMLLAACSQFGKVIEARALGQRIIGGHCLAYVIVEGRQAADAVADAARAGALTVANRAVSLVIVSGPFRRSSASRSLDHRPRS